MDNKFELNDKVKIAFSINDKYSNFFGYYGLSPIDIHGARMLLHRITFDGRDVRAKDSAEIGCWDIVSNKYISLAKTRAFNLQQGSNLQWLPPDYSTYIIYNDRTDKGFVARIINVINGERKTMPFPIYAIHPSGEYALAENYERYYFCRPGYNYQGIINNKWNKPIHKEDGVFAVNLKTGELKLLISTHSIAQLKKIPGMEQCDNYLEIFIWNPSGTRFAFLHRWNDEKGDHTTRLFTANADGSDIYMFPDTGFYSHMGWRNDQEFTIWAKKPSIKGKVFDSINRHEKLKNTVRPVYRWLRDKVVGSKMQKILPQAAYLECWDQTDRIEILGEGVLTDNGHNTWSKDQCWMLTDTYEDEENYRHLLLYDSKKNVIHEIGKFYSPYNACGYRCDLHPRFDHSEKYVIIDSAHEGGKRQMYVLDISNLYDE